MLRGPVEVVVEEYRVPAADGRLGDHVPRAGYVPRLEVLYTGEAGESPPVSKPDLLEEL